MNLEQIDTSTTAGKAEVMRLAAEGRRLVFRLSESRSKLLRIPQIWEACPKPLWNWRRSDYAIIAEPIGPEAMWIGFNDGGFVCGTSRTPYRGFERYIRADLAGEKG